MALNELAVEADQGKLANTDATFSQLAEQWLDLAKPGLGPQPFAPTGAYWTTTSSPRSEPDHFVKSRRQIWTRSITVL